MGAGRYYLVQHSELPALRLRRLVLARLHGAARENSQYPVWVLSEPSEGTLSTRGRSEPEYWAHPAAHICAGTGTHHGYHICAGTDTWYSRKDATTRLSSSTATTKLNEMKTKRCSGTEAGEGH